jgi:hypothetical protein
MMSVLTSLGVIDAGVARIGGIGYVTTGPIGHYKVPMKPHDCHYVSSEFLRGPVSFKIM